MSAAGANVHRGGCGLCRHMRRGKCRHPAYPIPVDYQQARKRGEPCGPGAALWEFIS